MKILALFVFFLVPVQPLAAKCGDKFYVFSGSVTDREGHPVASALVGVSWSQNARPDGPAMSLTDAEGRYSIPVHFNTYSGQSLRGDVCRGVLREVSISAYTGSERSWSRTLDIGHRDAVASRGSDAGNQHADPA